jgi:polyisoprenoid-binding protein YceI
MAGASPNPTCDKAARRGGLLECTSLIAWLFASMPSSGAEASSNALWGVRKAESTLSFRVAFEESEITGGFQSFAAQVRFDPQAPQGGSIDLRVDSVSISTADAGAAAIARQSNWLNVAGYPEIVFHSEGIRSLGANQYVAEGVLRLKGIGKPLAVPFTWTESGNAARLQGTVNIRRSSFGIGDDPAESTSPIAPSLGKEVAVSFTISLFRTANAQSAGH